MGHTIYYNSKVCHTTDEFKKAANDIYEDIMSNRDADYCDIMPTKKFDKIFKSKEDAYGFLDNEWQKDSDRSYAVRFTRKRSSKQKNLEERLAKEQQKLIDYKHSHLASKRKSATCGCTRCGSKIATSWIKDNNQCPVCGNSFYSETDNKTMHRYSENIYDLQTQIRELSKNPGRTTSSNDATEWLYFCTYNYHS